MISNFHTLPKWTPITSASHLHPDSETWMNNLIHNLKPDGTTSHPIQHPLSWVRGAHKEPDHTWQPHRFRWQHVTGIVCSKDATKLELSVQTLIKASLPIFIVWVQKFRVQNTPLTCFRTQDWTRPWRLDSWTRSVFLSGGYMRLGGKVLPH